MRVVVVGNVLWEWSAENDWIDAFRRLGHDVLPVHEAHVKPRQLLGASKAADLLLWVGASKRHPQRLMRDCGGHTRTAGVSTDLFWGLKRRGDWQAAPMFAADHVFTADGDNDEKWAEAGINHHWMLPAVRSKWIKYVGKVRARFASDVTFVGNNGATYHGEWPYRKELTSQLKKISARRQWKYFNPGGSHARVERNHRMSNVYASAQVTVGDSLCFNGQFARYWSDRVYEATGRGGVLIMPRINALVEQVPWMPTYEWGDWESLEAKIASLLSNEKEQRVFRAEGREWAATQTYEHRVRHLLEVVGL